MVKQKKICHLVRRYTTQNWGGIESVVSNLANEQQLIGFDPQIYTTAMLSQPGLDTVLGTEVHRFSYTFPFFSLTTQEKEEMEKKGGSPLSFSLFWSLLKEPNVSLIHTHVQHRLGGMARTIARLRKIPYVVTIHGGFFTIPNEQEKKMKQPFSGKWEWGKGFGWLLGSRRTLQDASAIICIGKDEYEQVKRKYPEKKVHHIPNGIHVDHFSNGDQELFRSRYGFKKEDRIILCVSRIDYQKNQLLLIDAFAEFQKKKPNHRLVFIGPTTVDKYRNTLLKRIEEYGIQDQVLLIEGLPPDDPLLPAAYRAADFFVLPSSTEPFGIVVLEAWAAGLPIIASCVGGVPGFTTHEQNILHFSDGNKEELLSQMNRLVKDSSLRENLVEKGKREVISYNWKEISKQMHALYEELWRDF